MSFLLVFFLFIVLSSAAPTSTSSSSSSFTHSSHATRMHPQSTNVHNTIPIFTRPPDFTPRFPPTSVIPIHTSSVVLPSSIPHSSQKPISIAFEVLGGLFASAILFGFLRCCYSYRKTPHRDRIAEVIHRHHLQRELEELERNPVLLRRPPLREPAPPYFPRPPSYDDMIPPMSQRDVAAQSSSTVIPTIPSG